MAASRSGKRSRPLYESGKDRLAARTVAETVAAIWGMEADELEPMAYADFIFRDSTGPVQLVEIKCRRNRFDAYPDIMIGLDKWRGLQSLSRTYGLPAILLVRFTDGCAWTQITTDPWLVREGGRTDRRDPRDVGPMAFTPMRRFHRI